MYIVDFRTTCYYDKCHDPNCKGFRSPLCQIREDSIPRNFAISVTEQLKNYTEENVNQYYMEIYLGVFPLYLQASMLVLS